MTHQIGQFGELQRYTQIGFVASVQSHDIVVAHHRKRIGQIDSETFTEYDAHHLFHDVANLLFLDKGKLDIDLRKLGLTIGSQVFIAETLDDLVVTIKPGNHEHLLEQLWRLRQRVKMPVVQSRRHQELTRTFRSRLVEKRRFNVDETVVVEKTPHRHGNLITQTHVALHLRASKVEHAVLEPHTL